MDQGHGGQGHLALKSGGVRRPDVLVVGTSVDSHVAAVLGQLPAELSVCRLDVDRFPTQQRLSIEPSDPPRVQLLSGEERWSVGEVSVCWFRRLGQPGVDPRIPEEHRAFALGEVEQTLAGVLSVIRPRHWVNEYWAARRAAVKLWQYDVITRLRIPFAPTIVTNDADSAQEWAKDGRPVVYKSLNSPLIEMGSDDEPRQFVFTSPSAPADLADDKAIRLTPCQFQARLSPVYELRVTTIGKQHFAVRIDHEPWAENESTDWRAHPERLKSSQYELPSVVETQLNKLMNALGLQYGASDWIVDEDANHTLLEVNPHGAWLWLEREVSGIGITRAVANYIASCVSRPRSE